MFIDYSEEHTLGNFGDLHISLIKSLFYNKDDFIVDLHFKF